MPKQNKDEYDDTALKAWLLRNIKQQQKIESKNDRKKTIRRKSNSNK